LAKPSKSIAGRALLVLGGVALLVFAFVYAKLPRASDPRIEAALTVVGVDTGGSYAWVMRTEHGAALVDCGADPRGAAILGELSKQGLKPADVHTVLLTHGHRDHWAACSLFPQAKVYVGPGELPYMRGEKKYGSLASMGEYVFTGLTLPSGLTELKGDETLDVDGEALRVIAVPGHTPGSVVYLWRDLLFVGDALVRQGKGVATSPSFFSEDASQARASLEKLIALPFTRLADGHTGLTDDARQKLGRFLR
jgi:glyoxylase-like metal-dependent hydrolase (beta-lactamase superfamily II)